MRIHPVLLATTLALGSIVAAPLVVPTSQAQAAESQAFTPAAFETAKKAGGPILVEVTAPWCPTCKAQKPTLTKLLGEPKFTKLTVFNVDFDSQKDALKLLGVRMQSTLISYKGEREVGRSTGVTDPQAIEKQLGQSL